MSRFFFILISLGLRRILTILVYNAQRESLRVSGVELMTGYNKARRSRRKVTA